MFFIKSVTFCVIRFNLGIEYLVKAMDFYFMGKNMGKNINKNLSGKYSAIARSDKLLDSAKKSGLTKVTADAFKTASNRSIKKNSRSNWRFDT